jgi:hypothetical protein
LPITREARFVAEFNYLYAKEWSVAVMTQLLAENLEVDQTAPAGEHTPGPGGRLHPHRHRPAELLVAAVFNFNSGYVESSG